MRRNLYWFDKKGKKTSTELRSFPLFVVSLMIITCLVMWSNSDWAGEVSNLVRKILKLVSTNNSRVRCVIVWQETEKHRQTLYGSKWWHLTLIISQNSLWHLVQLEGHVACHNMTQALLKLFLYVFSQDMPLYVILCSVISLIHWHTNRCYVNC